MEIQASIFIDVSHNFETRQASDWRSTFSGFCKELDEEVVEWSRVAPSNDFVTIFARYLINKDIVYESEEVWYFESSIDLVRLLESEGYSSCRIVEGYGDSDTNHRHIYVANKR